MLGVYVFVFIIAIFSICGCTKYHDKSIDSPKITKVDVSVKSFSPIQQDDTDFSEMQEFPEAELVDDLPIKIYHVTFIT